MNKPEYHVEIVTSFNVYGQDVVASNEVAALVIALEILNIRDTDPSDNFPVRVEIKRKSPR